MNSDSDSDDDILNAMNQMTTTNPANKEETNGANRKRVPAV
jgi:hypothetical protein